MDVNTITTHKDMSNAWRNGIVSFVCLEMSKQMKGEKNTADVQQCIYFAAKVVYFRFIDINRTKQ